MPAAAKATALSALVFVAGACFFAAGSAAEHNLSINPTQILNLLTNSTYSDNYTHLKTPVLQDVWKARLRAGPLYVVSELCESIGWALAIPGFLFLPELFASAKSASRVALAAFLMAAISSAINFTFQAGLVSTTDWMASWPAMQMDVNTADDVFPLQALEISYMVARSRTLWIFALDNFMIFIGFFLVSYLIFTARDRKLSKVFACWGFFTSLLAFICFVLDCLRMIKFFEVQVASSAINALIAGILLPSWLIGFTFTLRRVELQGPSYTATKLEVQKADEPSSEPTKPAGTFTDIELSA